MKVSIILEQRFVQCPDDSVWTPGPFPLSFFERYLNVFDAVDVVARVQTAEQHPPGWQQANGEAVRFRAIAHYQGPTQYLRKRRQVQRDLRAALIDAEAVILRVPSQLANLAEPWLRNENIPYALEIVGDPADVFSAGACRHPMRLLFKYQHEKRLTEQCARAPLLAYVTSEALQRRYQPNDQAFSTHYSSVELPKEAFRRTSPRRQDDERLRRLIMIGSLEHRYKGADILIEAVAALADGFELTIVGDGRERSNLRQLASALAAPVHFKGRLPAGSAIRRELDRADLFVLPSRQEGLPRVLLEAMARGLPCVASDVGGCTELLPAECLVRPNDVTALIAAIRNLADDPVRATYAGRQNYDCALQFADSLLQLRRDQFYAKLLPAPLAAVA